MDTINRISLDKELQNYIFKYILYKNNIDIKNIANAEFEYLPNLTFCKFNYLNDIYNYYMFDKGVYYFMLVKIIEVPEKQYKYNRKLYNNHLSRLQLRNELYIYNEICPFEIRLIDTLLDNHIQISNSHCYLTYWIDKKGKITGKETRSCPQVPRYLNSGGYGEYEYASLYSIDKYERICIFIEMIPILVPKTDTIITKIDGIERFKNYDYYLKLHKKAFKSKTKKAK